MKCFTVQVRGTYKTTDKKLKPFNYTFNVPTPIQGRAKYFATRLTIARLKMEEIIDFDLINKIYVVSTKPVEYATVYKGENAIIGKAIQDLTEYQVQEFAAMHNLRAIPYYQREDIDEIKKKAVIEYAKKLKPEIAKKIEDEFVEEHISQLPKLPINEPALEKVESETEVSAKDMFNDIVESKMEAPAVEEEKEQLFEEVPYIPEEAVEETPAEETSATGMTKEELIDALKGLGVKGINPNTGIEKLDAKYQEALKSVS